MYRGLNLLYQGFGYLNSRFSTIRGFPHPAYFIRVNIFVDIRKFNLMLSKKIVLKNILITLLTSILFINCDVRKMDFKGINLIVNYPVVQIWSGNIKVIDLLDTISIYYVNNYIVYKLGASRGLETGQKRNGSEPFFLYYQNSTIGSLYDSINQQGGGTKASVDSILFNRAYTGMKSDLSDSDWQKRESIREGESLIEKFIPKVSSDNPDNVDTAFFYYTNNLKEIEYSFSKKADSLAIMKLYKIRLLYKEKLTKDDKKIPAREIFFKIEKREISDVDSLIVNLVKRYDTFRNRVLKE